MTADDDLVDAAADAARMAEAGTPLSPAVLSLLRATALTRAEAERHELARQAEARLAPAGAVALEVLRVAIFALT